MIHNAEFSTSRRQGFTLIEMMLAVALGAMVVYVATAGFRVASQSISVVNRLAIENALIRSGMQVAHERLDFWTDCDDPKNSAVQKLRSKDNAGGMPFTPMKDVFPYVHNASSERVTGWNSKEPLSASDPRQWWRGSQAEDRANPLIGGSYALFGNTKPTATIPGYGTVTAAHSWLYNQTWGLHNAFGYYGYTDYMPANAMYGSHAFGDSDLDGIGFNLDGMPRLSLVNSKFSTSNTNAVWSTKGLWRLSTFSMYGLVSPTHPAGGIPSNYRKSYVCGYGPGANPGNLELFLREVNNSDYLLSSGGPAHWPRVSVSVSRFVKTARFVSLCTVKWDSPLTGEKAQLVLTGFGTSLRGARQQRNEAGTDWAHWDGFNNLANDPTLDGAP